MQFSEIYQAARGARFDSTQDTTIKRWVNQRYAWLWAQHDWPFKKNALANLAVTTGDNTPTPPANLLRVNQIFDDSGSEVRYLDPREFNTFYAYESTASRGKPYHYTVVNGVIIVGPTPDANYTFEIAYEARLTLLVADADVPAIPTEYHPILIVGAIAAGLREENDPTAPGVEQEFQFLYEAMVNSLLPPDAARPRQYGRDDL